VAPTPSTGINVLCPEGLFDGAEAYHTDPRFNRGVSVTLTPSVTAIKRIFEKVVFKCKGAIHPRPKGRGFTPSQTPIKINPIQAILFFNFSSHFFLMTFRKMDNGVEIHYDNGYVVKIKVEGDKLKLREEYNGRPYTDTMFYLSPSQVSEIKKALKEAKNADDVTKLLQGVMR